MQLADVALPVPVARAFTYAVPDAWMSRVQVGARVVCPFRTGRLLGVVLALREGEPPRGVKRIASVIEGEQPLPDDLLAFVLDLARYYLAPIGEAIRLALPPPPRDAKEVISDQRDLFAKGSRARHVTWVIPTAHVEASGSLRGQAAAVLAHVRSTGAEPLARLQERWGNARAAVKLLSSHGLVALEARDPPAAPLFHDDAHPDVAPELTAAQSDAVRTIGDTLREGRAKTLLLQGVTGSGKTEVYLRAIGSARDGGRGSIVLVPEIALTPQLVARFRARFGDCVAVLHSGLSPRERLVMWHRLREGEVDVAIGARSALFAPVRSLGLVVVDEEHDPSFKQDEGVRYHARDMAILRAHRARGVCLLGSATPSLESEHLVRTGRATRLCLPARARAQPLPLVELVDLRRTAAGPTNDKRVSMPLYRALEATLHAREQAILFLNRRGFAPSIRCEACGQVATCTECSVALTFHKREGVVRCHYCDFKAAAVTRCTACGAPALALEGIGTEQLEETISAAFPAARVARLDRDVSSLKKTEATLARMRAGEIDVLVGTQMVTKGHDLPRVTLVGVINADAALSLPDFRASERAFQLLVQVAGRAGRGDAPGRVIVQTWDPSHPAIAFAARHDVEGFLAREMIDRRELGYPPRTRAALVRVEAVDESVARAAATVLADVARAAASRPVVIQGPAPAPIARVRNRFRFRVMLRSENRTALRQVLSVVEEARAKLLGAVRSSIDVDPVQLL